MRYKLVQDDDSHWYVIPVDKEEEFDAWMLTQDYADGIAPDWANCFGGGPGSVTFENPEIFGQKYGKQGVPPEVYNFIEQLSLDGVVPVGIGESMDEVALDRFKIRIDQAKTLLTWIEK